MRCVPSSQAHGISTIYMTYTCEHACAGGLAHLQRRAQAPCDGLCCCLSPTSQYLSAVQVPRALTDSYAASVEGCTTGGGLSDAYKPLSSLGLDPFGCEVFSTRYPILVQNIARFIANSGYAGRVIFLTTPPGVRNCDLATMPGQRPKPPATPATKAAEPEEYYFEQTRYAGSVPRFASAVAASSTSLRLFAASRSPPPPPPDGGT